MGGRPHNISSDIFPSSTPSWAQGTKLCNERNTKNFPKSPDPLNVDRRWRNRLARPLSSPAKNIWIRPVRVPAPNQQQGRRRKIPIMDFMVSFVLWSTITFFAPSLCTSPFFMSKIRTNLFFVPMIHTSMLFICNLRTKVVFVSNLRTKMFFMPKSRYPTSSLLMYRVQTISAWGGHDTFQCAHWDCRPSGTRSSRWSLHPHHRDQWAMDA